MNSKPVQLEKQQGVIQDIKEDSKNLAGLCSGNEDSGEDRGEEFERAIE